MKKGTRTQGIVDRIEFPNKGIVFTEDGEKVIVKNTIPGQKVEFIVNKVRRGKAEGRLMEVVEKSPLEEKCDCPHFGICGGCVYKSLPYEKQLELKENQVKKLIEDAVKDKCEYEFLPAIASPSTNEYRNKMEFTFGDEYLDGPLALGMHKRGSFYDIVPVTECKIMDGDFRTILKEVTNYFREKNISFYHRMRHEGYLRHLLVRKATKTGEILVDLITSTQVENLQVNEDELLEGFKNVLLNAKYTGKIKGILHTKNDSLADVVKDEGTDILFGDNFFFEEIIGLKFKISPFSFFQTNSLGAEVLYETARQFIRESVEDESALNDKIVYDLYSGTGTIAQMMSPVAKKVVGVEIIEEAVEAAKDNAKLNNIDNCEFIAGDVLKVIDDIEEKPNYIVLDPPRDGIHPKAIGKIIDYGVENMVYISCKPTSLARDLEIFLARGYKLKKVRCVDMFPFTANVETVCLLSKLHEAKHHINVKVDMDELDLTSAEAWNHRA
ncbi:23S rRNA (uracil(1939)-C(5))-methyltransferase RlmD [Lachnobacterium bovis]|uniref:23S rRNA (Uracil-5-)-methyltransferase RumA n=1 Tax=Lachnobacterium bovis DSM 14045 TaxID=1122142 RepID=A0A1H3J9E3_9FIRM|nr:23S rRNA (uracil(1939)-C(5))-methyltransferase RlmD [Lachnobacterium bovis]SDY36532.1 23S rRNA (uracil-5-)-methyltransferase RumA [Lachnobacterium bovis DSM 14045]